MSKDNRDMSNKIKYTISKYFELEIKRHENSNKIEYEEQSLNQISKYSHDIERWIDLKILGMVFVLIISSFLLIFWWTK